MFKTFEILNFGHWDLFVVWILQFGALKQSNSIYFDVNSSSPLRLILSSAARTLSGSAGA